MQKYDNKLRDTSFRDYDEYMQFVFNCVNTALDQYIDVMKTTYASEQGGYKSILYPDIEIAGDTCRNQIERFYTGDEADQDTDKDAGQEDLEAEDENGDSDESEDSEVDDELMALLGAFSVKSEEPKKSSSAGSREDSAMSLREKLEYIDDRAAATIENGIPLPFYTLTKKLKFEPFTVFCFACGILSSTQTDYAGVFQIVNENGNLSAPTIESAAKLYFGESFSVTTAYGDMSACLEQLMPILHLEVRESMPFSTVVSPDKRMIDFLFGRHPLRRDEN